MEKLLILIVTLFLIAACLDSNSASQPFDSSVSQEGNNGDDTSAFYDPNVVQRIELEVTSSDLKSLHDALPKRIYVPGVFRWKDRELRNVGIRYKGNSSSSPHQTHKRSFLIKFSEFESGQRFLGLRRVALDNGVQFGSLFSERILGDILRTSNVIVSRSNYATVYLNDEYIGVYVNVERIDQSFIDRYFTYTDGNLYKVDTGGPGGDLTYQGDDATKYTQAFEIKTNKSTADYSDIVELVRVINQAADAEFDKWLMDKFDIQGFQQLMAVMLLGGAFDQYTGFAPHNYYLYHELTLDKWYYIVWDLDVGFADNAFGKVPVINGWDASYPLAANTTRPLIKRIIADPTRLAAYRSRTASLLEKHFKPEKISEQIDSLYALIDSDLANDPFPAGRVTVRGETTWAETISAMKAFAQTRYDKAISQLANPANQPPDIIPPKGNEPAPGPPSSFDPTHLTVISSSRGMVELSWTDNATDEFAYIVQKCIGSDCADFENAIGFPKANITRATDGNVRTGQTYRYRVYAMRPGVGGTGPSNIVTVTVD